MRKGWLVWFVVVWLAAVACNLGGAATAKPTAAVQTAAALTVQAVMTASAVPAGGGAPTLPAQATAGAPTSAPQITLAPSATPLPPPTTVPPTATVAACHQARFVADVTVPDGTVLAPGASFTKTWRLKNVGTCTWQNYSLVFDHGEAMGGPASVPIPATVAPGQQVDVSVTLTAPTKPGTYKGYWRLRDDKGVVFGLTTGVPFWVEVRVAAPTATATLTPALGPPAMLVLDFYSEAPAATWYGGGNTALPFPGADNDSRGFARYADGYLLEDGQSYSGVLETHPEWVNDGAIAGHYPAVTLPSGAHFRAQIGFLAQADGSCGVGEVDFDLLAGFNGQPPVVIASWHKACTGALQSVEMDLSAHAGQTAIFVLRVRAAGSSGQDWAVWVDPRIATP